MFLIDLGIVKNRSTDEDINEVEYWNIESEYAPAHIAAPRYSKPSILIMNTPRTTIAITDGKSFLYAGHLRTCFIMVVVKDNEEYAILPPCHLSSRIPPFQ